MDRNKQIEKILEFFESQEWNYDVYLIADTYDATYRHCNPNTVHADKR